jgi:hypothetical protein
MTGGGEGGDNEGKCISFQKFLLPNLKYPLAKNFTKEYHSIVTCPLPFLFHEFDSA